MRVVWRTVWALHWAAILTQRLTASLLRLGTMAGGLNVTSQKPKNAQTGPNSMEPQPDVHTQTGPIKATGHRSVMSRIVYNTLYPMPSFEQARGFAKIIGLSTPEAWAKFIIGMSREDLFQRVLSVIAGRVITTPLED